MVSNQVVVDLSSPPYLAWDHAICLDPISSSYMSENMTIKVNVIYSIFKSGCYPSSHTAYVYMAHLFDVCVI